MKVQYILVPILSLFMLGCSTGKSTTPLAPIKPADHSCETAELLQRDLSDESQYEQRNLLYVMEDGSTCRY